MGLFSAIATGLGAIGGFLVGGPTGAKIGAGIGGSIGAAAEGGGGGRGTSAATTEDTTPDTPTIAGLMASRIDSGGGFLQRPVTSPGEIVTAEAVNEPLRLAEIYNRAANRAFGEE